MSAKRVVFCLFAVLCLGLGCSAAESISITPGVLFEERQLLYKLLTEAEKDGVGIKGYLAHFKIIEEKVKSNASEDSIKDLVNRVEAALSQQLGVADRSELRKNLHGERVVTDYCELLERELAKTFVPLSKQINEHCELCLTVNADGSISKLRVSKDDKSKKSMQELALKKVAGIGKFPLPPKAPLPLNCTICEKPEHIECTYDGKVEYDAYLVLIQRRIKSHWYPPKGSVSKRVEAHFEVLRDGSIVKAKIAVPSPDPLYDKAALKTLVNCSPLLKLPDGSPKSVDVQFTFDYNVNRKNKI